jgi:DNA-binding beta-propeller fold protein YncE
VGDNFGTVEAGSAQGSSGNTTTILNCPTGFTIDPMGNLYVTDRLNQRIQFFQSGSFEGVTIAGVTGQVGSKSETLNSPFTVALDNQLNLYVANNLNHSVQRFLRC